ncbi:MAG: AAA family ATPase [Dehalococcoidales bacterium]|nr:AAA family ATPase [Dehalococcoidales bacterium]
MPTAITGERKQVTVVFSDLSGYTSISEKLDPEEVHDLMNKIFTQATKIIARYEGYIDKFIGDAVMALFGVPRTHEDDALRAIKAVQDLHSYVKSLSPQFEDKLGSPILMHSGISTGLIVAYNTENEEENEKVLGDTINLASRLTGLAKSGEIVVGEASFKLTERFFKFEALKPTLVKGKEQTVQAYKVIESKDNPVTIHRLTGMRSHLVGRNQEIHILKNTARRLIENKESSLITICGEAGIGKSRLVSEFKAGLDKGQVQWLEGHAYAFAQNTPYFPLVDLFSRLWNIKENEPVQVVKAKIEEKILSLGIKDMEVIPYLGSLFGLEYPETEKIEPELWKHRLFRSIYLTLLALAEQKAMVIFLEDLHWADPSTTELFLFLSKELRTSVLLLVTYRPSFSLFDKVKQLNEDMNYQEIRLRDFTLTETEEMLQALLQTARVPQELRQFIQDKAENNPFYLEEVVNSLLEMDILISVNGEWRLTHPINESVIPSTIEGVIISRLDHLEIKLKKALQEASVIGRIFLYNILKRITEIQDQINESLSGLEDADMIRTLSLKPDLEYIFKHALTQDVAYNSLLKKDRQALHERIGQVIEEIFIDRLPDFYETLAYHYKQTNAIYKAVHYLMKSAEKAIRQYSSEEAHRYCRDAYGLLSNNSIALNKDHKYLTLLFDLINQWSMVYYLRADVEGKLKLLQSHLSEAQGLKNNSTLGMYYFWLGLAYWDAEDFENAARFASEALRLGEEMNNQLVIGYASSCLAFANAELGFTDEALFCGKKARQIAVLCKDDPYNFLYEMGTSSLGYVSHIRGDTQKTLEYGYELIETGTKNANIRAEALGNVYVGWGFFDAGDYLLAFQYFEKCTAVSRAHPWYSQAAKLFMGLSLLLLEQFIESKKYFVDILTHSESYGGELLSTAARTWIGCVDINEGNLNQGMKKIMAGGEVWVKSCKHRYAWWKWGLGCLMVSIAKKKQSISLISLLNNFNFVLRYAIFARKLARVHLNEGLIVAKEIGAKAIIASCYLELGYLNQIEKKYEHARMCFSEAIRIYQDTGADFNLKLAKEALAALR